MDHLTATGLPFGEGIVHLPDSSKKQLIDLYRPSFEESMRETLEPLCEHIQHVETMGGPKFNAKVISEMIWKESNSAPLPGLTKGDSMQLLQDLIQKIYNEKNQNK